MKGTMITVPVTGPIVITTHDKMLELEQLQAGVGGYLETVPYLDSYDHAGRVVRCVAFCNEEGKLHGLEPNQRAQLLWIAALQRQGHGAPMDDYLVGDIVILFGDNAFMAAL